MDYWSRFPFIIICFTKSYKRFFVEFPKGNSALMLAAARLRHIAGTCWGTRRYMNMDRLQEQTVELIAAAG
jgi:hypothetical protein